MIANKAFPRPMNLFILVISSSLFHFTLEMPSGTEFMVDKGETNKNVRGVFIKNNIAIQNE